MNTSPPVSSQQRLITVHYTVVAGRLRKEKFFKKSTLSTPPAGKRLWISGIWSFIPPEAPALPAVLSSSRYQQMSQRLWLSASLCPPHTSFCNGLQYMQRFHSSWIYYIHCRNTLCSDFVYPGKKLASCQHIASLFSYYLMLLLLD